MPAIFLAPAFTLLETLVDRYPLLRPRRELRFSLANPASPSLPLAPSRSRELRPFNIAMVERSQPGDVPS
jgi:hypothetical protein